jgi:cytolysin (calcineurin-like family phosphatase)
MFRGGVELQFEENLRRHLRGEGVIRCSGSRDVEAIENLMNSGSLWKKLIDPVLLGLRQAQKGSSNRDHSLGI